MGEDITTSPEKKEVPEKISDQAILMLKLAEISQRSREAQTVPIFQDASIGNARHRNK